MSKASEIAATIKRLKEQQMLYYPGTREPAAQVSDTGQLYVYNTAFSPEMAVALGRWIQEMFEEAL